VSSVAPEWTNPADPVADPSAWVNPSEASLGQAERPGLRVAAPSDEDDGAPRTLKYPESIGAPATSETFANGHRRELRHIPPQVFAKSFSSAATVPLQEWEGFVTWIDGERFGGRLFDMTDPGELEEMEFTIDEVSRDDIGLLTEGAVFYWTIARHTNEVGTRTNVSILRFRRLPARSQRARASATKRAAALSEKLGID
jgi:hypothetical protein